MRPKIEAFNAAVIGRLGTYVEVCQAPICRVEQEFRKAVAMFERENVDAIVTMHLGYSPSLESSKVLAETEIPIVVLDTTCQYDFGPSQSVDEIMYNHGIHGVQDMCNLLKRSKKKYFVEAGHWEKSDVMERVVSCIRSAVIYNSLRHSRVGMVGKAFEGMGDFAVPLDQMKAEVGIETVYYDFEWAKEALAQVTEEEIAADFEICKEAFQVEGISDEVWCRSARVNLVLRRWMKENRLKACTVNFLATQEQPGLPVMPFLEISRSMAEGIGYAGEGDVLTAAFVGALLSVYREATFSEMFCPDWKGNSIMLSHMGEINVAVTAEKALVVEKEFPFTDAENPVAAYGCLKAGRAVLADLAPLGEGKYTLIVSPVEMLDVLGGDNMAKSVHGWFRPVNCDICRFLSDYSMAGGTHHLAVVYGAAENEIERFGDLMGFEVVSI